MDQSVAALPTVDGPCMLRVTFLLPPDKYTKDFSYGSDIDDFLFLKRFLLLEGSVA
jgi:hypothetical protein